MFTVAFSILVLAAIIFLPLLWFECFLQSPPKDDE